MPSNKLFDASWSLAFFHVSDKQNLIVQNITSDFMASRHDGMRTKKNFRTSERPWHTSSVELQSALTPIGASREGKTTRHCVGKETHQEHYQSKCLRSPGKGIELTEGQVEGLLQRDKTFADLPNKRHMGADRASGCREELDGTMTTPLAPKVREGGGNRSKVDNACLK